MLAQQRPQDFGIAFFFTNRGMEISAVKPDSPAQKIGLEAGDVIESVHGHPPVRAETWNWLMSGDNGYVRFSIVDVRTGRPRTLYVSLGYRVPVG